MRRIAPILRQRHGLGHVRVFDQERTAQKLQPKCGIANCVGNADATPRIQLIDPSVAKNLLSFMQPGRELIVGCVL